MTIAIRAEGLSKQYLIRQRRVPRATSLKDELTQLASRFGRGGSSAEHAQFWALRDASFEIEAGSRVGIIGRNGAGKSTLLKLLSRITEPSAGRATIHGRVASLLEVGTGFHPELSGRENIFLNGAILGMRRDEIRRKFDEIVDFAEVEKFLDMPVKRYSSGMYVRLAFAVAAHLEPEILIVDEVLAVGDASFQKKCLAKMTTVGQQGTTVLFVSHNIAAIQHLCSTALLLGEGRILQAGDADQVIRHYLEQSHRLATIPLAQRDDRQGNQVMRLTDIRLQDDGGRPIGAAHCGQSVQIVFRFMRRAGVVLEDLVIGISVDNEFGLRVAEFSNGFAGEAFAAVAAGQDEIVLQIPRLPLTPGVYRLTVSCSAAGELADRIDDAAVLVVEHGDFFGTGRLPAADSQVSMLVPHRFVLRDVMPGAA